MGVIAEFAKERIEEARRELEKITEGPIKFLQSEQPLRKIILLEFLDYVRPRKYAEYQDRISKMKVTPMVEGLGGRIIRKH